MIGPGLYDDEFAPGITVYDAKLLFETNHTYSIVPDPPDGKVILTIFAGSYPPQNDSLYPIVPALVTLQHTGPLIVKFKVKKHPVITSVTVT